MRMTFCLVAATLLSGPVVAQDLSGDPSAGEEVFNRCITCHGVVDPEGNTLAGRARGVGPNLYGVIGQPAGADEDFRYSTAMEEAGDAGLTWTEENFAAYTLDPSGFLQTYLDDSSARGRMAFRLRDEQEAADVAAYLQSLSQE